VKRTKKRERRGATLGIENNFGSTVLDTLQTLNVVLRYTEEKRIAVVKTRANNRGSKQVRSRDIKITSDVTKSAKMKVGSPADFRDVRVESELRV
jgi:hypothetical protein